MAAALEQTEQRRLQLIGDVAHELRTPVATSRGYLEGLMDGVVEPTDQTWARLHGQTGRLQRVVDDLRELLRAEGHQLTLNPQMVSVADTSTSLLTDSATIFSRKVWNWRCISPKVCRG